MKVFLSSTAEDLAEYRTLAEKTIRDLSEEIDIVAMEHFGPRPETPIKECERLARESDILVCIVAHRYGSIPEAGGKSFTQREVEAAHNDGKKILAWILDDNFKWTEKREQDLFLDPAVIENAVRGAEVQERIRKLVEFKTWLRSAVITEKFTTPDDLGRKIAIALPKFIPRREATVIGQDRISIARLPITSSSLFGREEELKILDAAWANPNTNIVSFVAWGGVGKTALVNHWLKQHMARDNYRSATRVYGWSFFSQGTSERTASADLFIDQALRWFDDTDPTAGSPWDKGERLAGYIRQSRTLLILDGLEPLQHPPGFQEGRLKDAAVQALLVELAAHQPGLCVISTREPVGDLVGFENSTVIQHNLEHLSPQAGAQILRSLNVKGEMEELEQAAIELGGHAFSLTLLGSYLDEVLEGDIRRRREIEDLFSDTRYGDAAQNMIAAYETWLGDGMELAILRLLGLFDRPAELTSLVALREPPVISGLTESLQHFKGRQWNQAVAKLRRMKLIGEVSPDEPGMLDAHPLVREYFKQQLKRNRAAAWRKANDRLYEHLSKITPEYPETVQEMSPLYAAVAHGCSAGKYQEVLNNVYRRRIQRGFVHFNANQLGAYGVQLAVLSNFFETPWERPVEALKDIDKGFVLHDVSATLRAQGRPQEAIQPARAALEISLSKEEWNKASAAAYNLRGLYFIIGDLENALAIGQQSVELAYRGEDLNNRCVSLAGIADVLHQTGQLEIAGAKFREAEQIQEQFQPEFPLLYSYVGFTYCDWSLSCGNVEEVKARAARTLSWSKTYLGPLSTALDNLSLARASLVEAQVAQKPEFSATAGYLASAIDGLRQAGMMDALPLGLLTRAQLYRLTNNFDAAHRDLAETYRIITRSGMGLHLADYHLEFARLSLVQVNNDKARKHLATAKEMINRMGYHRRNKEVAELEAQLA